MGILQDGELGHGNILTAAQENCDLSNQAVKNVKKSVDGINKHLRAFKELTTAFCTRSKEVHKLLITVWSRAEISSSLRPRFSPLLAL
jgi:hypothetical protein